MGHLDCEAERIEHKLRAGVAADKINFIPPAAAPDRQLHVLVGPLRVGEQPGRIQIVLLGVFLASFATWRLN